MYGYLRPRNNTYRWGRYYTTVPQSIPVTEQGRPFRFAFADSTSTMNEVVENLEAVENSITITTTYDYNWSSEGSILIDEKLYKIQDGVQTTQVADNTYGLTKSIRKRYTMEISNPVGLRR